MAKENTPGLQQAGHGEVVPHFALLLHQATTWSSSIQHQSQRAALKGLMLPLPWVLG